MWCAVDAENREHDDLKRMNCSCYISYIFFCLVQEMYKASKYEVSPDMKLVLLAYNVQPVRLVFVCVRVLRRCNHGTGWKRRHASSLHQKQTPQCATVRDLPHTYTPASWEKDWGWFHTRFDCPSSAPRPPSAHQVPFHIGLFCRWTVVHLHCQSEWCCGTGHTVSCSRKQCMP